MQDLQHLIVTPDSIFRFQAMFILSLLASRVIGSHSELLTLDAKDVELLKAGSFPMYQVLRFVDAVCFSPKNHQLLVNGGIVEFLSVVFDDSEKEAEQELAAVVISMLLATEVTSQ